MIKWNGNMEKKAKLCYMETSNFVIYIKTENIHIDFATDTEARLYSSNSELDRPFPKGKNGKLN